MAFFGFLIRKKFYIHFGLSILLTLVILLLVFRFLKGYTRHGDILILPDFSGMSVESVKMSEYGDLYTLEVIDSIYDMDLMPGSIVKQNPSAGSKVKEGRKVYVSLVAMTPEMTSMPVLKDLTVRQAVGSLRTSGLRIGSLRFARSIADNAVIGHFYDGDTIFPGTELKKGSMVDLVVGTSGLHKMNVPYLLGLTKEEAFDKIHASSFNAGSVRFMDGPEDSHSRVYRQSPGWDEMIMQGDTINIWFRSDLKFNFEAHLKYNDPNSAMRDSTITEEDKDDIF